MGGSDLCHNYDLDQAQAGQGGDAKCSWDADTAEWEAEPSPRVKQQQ